jgi:RNA polymerase sigma factor (sigma-70 family)
MAEDQEKLMQKAFTYQDTLEAYANSILRDWNLSKDAVQEAFIKANLKWQEIDENLLFACLKKLTHDKAIDMLRHEKRLSRVREEIDKLIDRHMDVFLDESAHEKNQLRLLVLEDCMKKIRPESTNLLVSYYKDLTACDTIAENMQRPISAVRVLLNQTRLTLRKCIKSRRLINE